MEKKAWVLLNGCPQASIDPFDRGFQYGDGVFTTLRVVDGIPLLGNEHLCRLERDAARIRLPGFDASLLRREMTDLGRRCSQGILKIQLTRGVSERGYQVPQPLVPTRFLSIRPHIPFSSDLPNGLRVRLSEQRLSINPLLSGIKHMNRLEQVMARMEWDDPDIDESLMMDTEGFLVEGTMTNLFLFKDQTLLTPLIDRCGVQGVMRDCVIQMARSRGFDVRETRLELSSIQVAEAMFLTNSIRGICPVREFCGQSLPGRDFALKVHEWYLDALRQSLGAWVA